MLTGRLRVGAWLVCLALVATGIYLFAFTPGPAPFEKIEGTLHDVTVLPNDDPRHPDRIHELNITGAACGDYDYSESWARSVRLPSITDLDANRPITVYADPHACPGFQNGGSAPARAIVFQGRLYATDAYLHPRDPRLDNLPAAIVLVLAGAGGAGLLIFRSVATRR